MPYKDKEQAKKAARERQRKHRAQGVTKGVTNEGVTAEANRIISHAQAKPQGDVSQVEIDALPQALKDDINRLCDSDPVMYDDRDERFVRAVLYRRKFPDQAYHSNHFTGKDRSLAKPGDADYPGQDGTSTCKYCNCSLVWDILECCNACAESPLRETG